MGRRKNRTVIGDDEELALVRQLREAERLGRSRDRYVRVMAGLKAITEPSGPQVKVHDVAKDRRAELERAFHNAGLLVGTTVPMPIVDGKPISNHEFERRGLLATPQALFVQPPQSLWTPEAHMTAFGQASHWTVVDEAARAKITWEPVDYWRWFWFEVSADCPRLETSWNDLNAAIRLASLEEYELAWHLHKTITGKMLDRRTWCWLRTRFARSGALRAGGYSGEVGVDGHSAGLLASAFSDEGGRTAEVVKKPAA